MSDVFISYASQDRDRVQPLAEALAATQGWSVWWDREIPFGKPFDQVIGEALAAARCVVVVWSTRSITSGWVIEEAQNGREREILVPVLIDDVDIPFGFRRIQAARLLDWDGSVTTPVFRKLVADIAGVLGSAPKPIEPKRAPQPPSSGRVPTVFKKFRYRMVLGLVALLAAAAAGVAVFVPTVHPPEREQASSRLEGTYRATGKNPNGTTYQGEAVIQRDGDRYEITWKLADKQTLYGSGTLANRILNIQWSGGLVTYVVRKDGTLQGSWAGGEGTETLVPQR